jgi:hypothetical protein
VTELPMTPKIVAILLLAGLTVGLGSLAARPMKGGPAGIVWLELAPTVSRANAFLASWKTHRFAADLPFQGDWKARLQTTQAWDTWFICAYAPFFALLCWLAAAHFAPVMPTVGAWGRGLAGAQLLAGALDFLENTAVNHMIEREVAERPWPFISASASGVKWLLILAFLGYALAAAIHGLLAASHPS